MAQPSTETMPAWEGSLPLLVAVSVAESKALKSLELSCTAADKCKIGQLLAKSVCQFLIKLSIHLLDEPIILLLGVYSRGMNMYVHQKGLYMNIHSTFIHNGLRWKQHNVHQEVNEYTVEVWSYNGIAVTNKKEQTTNTQNIDKT